MKKKTDAKPSNGQEVSPFTLENNEEASPDQVNESLLKKVSTKCTIGDLSPDTQTTGPSNSKGKQTPL